jgi:hypothetical protein
VPTASVRFGFETACWPVLRRRRLGGFVPSFNPLRSSAGRGCELPGAVLKILVSYPDGFADMEDLVRDMAITHVCGQGRGRSDSIQTEKLNLAAAATPLMVRRDGRSEKWGLRKSTLIASGPARSLKECIPDLKATPGSEVH